MRFFGSRNRRTHGSSPPQSGGGEEGYVEQHSDDDVDAGLEALERLQHRQDTEDREAERRAREKILRMTIWVFGLLLVFYGLIITLVAIGVHEQGSELAQRRVWQLITYLTPIFASYWGFYYATTTKSR
ncbi:MAG: hypothetical protein ACRDHN_02505 [Thermomicrobiales bacterium]